MIIFDYIKPGMKKLKIKQAGCRLEYAGCKQQKLGNFARIAKFSQ